MLLWLGLKPWVIAIGCLLIAFENIAGVRTFIGVLPGYAVLITSLAVGLAMKVSFRTRRMPSLIAHMSFLFDSFIIVAGIYFHGGLETPWAFGPSFVTFMGAYVFGMGSGLLYALYTCSLLFIMFFLEYYKLIPHFQIFGIQDLYRLDPGYFYDSLMGLCLLNFAMAFAVASLSRLTDRRGEKIEQYVKKLETSSSNLRSLEGDVLRAAKLAQDKGVDALRLKSIIEGRETEIAQTQEEIERLKRRKSA